MTTKYYTLEGKIKWANSPYGGLFNHDPKFNVWKAQIYPTPEGWEVFKKSGLQIKTYQDDDGDYILLRRPTEKIIKGELTKFGRPKVFFVEGIEPTKDIGNGSTVTANFSVYPTQKGPGHRLEAVTVKDLVQYDRAGAPSNLQELKEESTEESNDVEESDESSDAGTPFNDGIPFGRDEKPADKEPAAKSSSSTASASTGASRDAKKSPFRKSA